MSKVQLLRPFAPWIPFHLPFQTDPFFSIHLFSFLIHRCNLLLLSIIPLPTRNLPHMRVLTSQPHVRVPQAISIHIDRQSSCFLRFTSCSSSPEALETEALRALCDRFASSPDVACRKAQKTMQLSNGLGTCLVRGCKAGGGGGMAQVQDWGCHFMCHTRCLVTILPSCAEAHVTPCLLIIFLLMFSSCAHSPVPDIPATHSA